MRSAPTDQLSITLMALADPTRRAILTHLSDGEATVNELAKPFALTLPGVSKHLRVLQKAGLITQTRRAQWRPCRLKAQPLREIADWVSRYREFWEESFDSLDQLLTTMGSVGSTDPQETKETP